ncbi:sn-glycerol-3-phosphate ABC transporter substrate-binding protein UgpB [Rosenbergiella australiborealis]|uniref:sn-glycerol-3-phosphate-binding periplasmic protein UgpB n=1 Tax=Rosenbergiella australiborealis TaxID=1544696 RepID=A0ABS5T4S3_9GAMM|nr:sn-glycerol-3-phosphate ABC transporter substrate-binding protein UgpB [Rosenbergiella australiborealis]MBT0727355.1 sn-glycerol-3-phosphate ABC transporter substrate-binding protein UgpB [Rosenbergiella australiborealis]
MRSTTLRRSILALCLTTLSVYANASVDIPFWHSMEGELGTEVDSLAQRFNQTHTQYHITPVYKGNYSQSLASGIAAIRAGHPPAILQVYEVGTATMMASHAIIPVWELFQETNIHLDEQQFVPSIASYYSDAKTGKIVAEPFNSSTPVLYFNKDAFKRAGLDPNKAPATWQELEADAQALKKSGQTCSYSSGWQGWIQLEEFSAWNGLPVATANNGFDGTDTRLLFNGPLQVQHIEQLARMKQDGTFSYLGRTDEPTKAFSAGDCAMITASSGSLADIKHSAKFNYGVAPMPYQQGVKDAPQNAMIGGASLWVMKGQTPDVYKGVAEFLRFLSQPDIAAEWHQKTGYLPITTAAYQLTEKQGFYSQNPGADIAIKQMLNKAPLPYTKGLRLGNMPQIRTIVDEELESVWTGKKTAQAALDSAVERGDQQLQRFRQQVK